MNTKKKFFIISMPIIMAICSLFLICDYVDAAPRTAIRTNATSRKSTTVKAKTTIIEPEQNVVTETESNKPESEPEQKTEINVVNKSNQFDGLLDEVLKESSSSDNSFAEEIRRQRAALLTSESTGKTKEDQNNALKSGKNACDTGLRECMIKTCGNDFTKCALDGDTIFGDKLNKCRRDTECTGEEFKLFTTEIKADRDLNVKLLSYTNVINCGNAYNACMQNQCGKTFSTCLGKAKADAAIQKCTTIAKECSQYDSGLTSRFNSAIGTLRENAEKEIAKDEKRLYELRELMANQCKSLGAMFDERTFDCVYTINFFAGENQKTPMASKKAYAGDSFICNQEWFGINATTYKENAYRETRAQTAASSAMLGAGLGTAAGLASSGAIGRAIDTHKAKKALDAAKDEEACKKSNNTTWQDGNCVCNDEDTKWDGTECVENTSITKKMKDKIQTAKDQKALEQSFNKKIQDTLTTFKTNVKKEQSLKLDDFQTKGEQCIKDITKITESEEFANISEKDKKSAIKKAENTVQETMQELLNTMG